MEEFDELSDGELLFRLRLEYINALKIGDFYEIDHVIRPGFWDRFGRHYDKFERSWKNVSFGMPIRLVLNPTDEKAMKMDWMDQVLQGHLEPDLSDQ